MSLLTTKALLTHLNEHLTVGDLDALDTPDLIRMKNCLQHWAYTAEKRVLERHQSPRLEPDPWWLSLE